jgi:fructose-1,6-bisphosphatase/inositol monophosphatase family enzyme
MIPRAHDLLDRIRAIHAAIRESVLDACAAGSLDDAATPVAFEGGDTIFAIDRVSETVLLEWFRELAHEWPCVLVAEGLGATGRIVLPEGTDAAQAVVRIIVDPIDGTRGLMYQKRPAWILTGVAPEQGESTGLDAIELAVMTEIPLMRQHLSDSFFAVRGEGAVGERRNRLTGETRPLAPQPSRATDIVHGFGQVARFFPGARDVLAAIEEDLIARIVHAAPAGTGLTFEDQYISSGGQLYELMMGHDRWVADLRPLLEPVLAGRGLPPGLYGHPYDLCTELVAREAGVIVTDARGGPLRASLDVHSPIAWAGYANPAIAALVQPALTAVLAERGLL